MNKELKLAKINGVDRYVSTLIPPSESLGKERRKQREDKKLIDMPSR